MSDEELLEQYAAAVDFGRRKGREEMKRAVVTWLSVDVRARYDIRRTIPIAVRRRIINAIPWDLFVSMFGDAALAPPKGKP